MAKKGQSKKISKKIDSRWKVLFFLTIILSIASSVGLLLQKGKSYPEFIFTYKECVENGGRTNLNTYPKSCYIDEKTYYEDINNPVDTSDWIELNVLNSFTVKCPPTKVITKLKDHSAKICGVAKVKVITPDNYNQSDYNNPYYLTPRAWLEGLKRKESNALLPFERVRAFNPNPRYFYDYAKMSEYKADKLSGLKFGSGPYTGEILFIFPIRERDILVLTREEKETYENVFYEIINSIDQIKIK